MVIPRLLTATKLGRIVFLPLRYYRALKGAGILRGFITATRWTFRSRDLGGGNYRTETINQLGLSALISHITGKPISDVVIAQPGVDVG